VTTIFADCFYNSYRKNKPIFIRNKIVIKSYKSNNV